MIQFKGYGLALLTDLSFCINVNLEMSEAEPQQFLCRHYPSNGDNHPLLRTLTHFGSARVLHTFYLRIKMCFMKALTCSYWLPEEISAKLGSFKSWLWKQKEEDNNTKGWTWKVAIISGLSTLILHVWYSVADLVCSIFVFHIMLPISKNNTSLHEETMSTKPQNTLNLPSWCVCVCGSMSCLSA